MMPGFQVMDYAGALDPEVGVGPSRALRVDCNPRVGVALRAAKRISEIVDAQRSAAAIPDEVALRMRRLARLIYQATSWRTLAELNRDVFLAENLSWLAREAYPGARIVALAHTSHSEPLPRRMGALLRESHADDYRTVSMYALSGAYREHRQAATLGPAAAMETVTLSRESNRPLERYLATLAPHDLIVRLAGDPVVRQGLPAGLDLELAPDVAIVVGEVAASRALAPP
jgi:erythromycin esterase-like protein